MIETQLLCTFSDLNIYDTIINKIKITYEIIYQKIFVLQDCNDDNNLMCTYNIEQGNSINAIPNTIVVHRKKYSNTLYTINALNTLIRSSNNGVMDINYIIDWNQYHNCIILSTNNEINIIKTKIKDIIKL